MNPVVHFEMPAEDRKRMADFYTKVFGWKTQQLGEDMRNYILIYKDQHRAAKECGYASLLWLKSYYFSYL
jgi:predicted enzyme related to lactoylglutathione lyase